MVATGCRKIVAACHREVQALQVDLLAVAAAQVWRLSAREHVLLIVQHHSITDGISLGILGHELAAAYSAAQQGIPADLPALSVAYIDYAVWQRQQMSGDALEAELAWWRRTLADAPALLELPTDRPRPSSITFAGANHSFTAPAPVRRGLQQLAKSRQTTEFVVVLAALQVGFVNRRARVPV